MNATTRRVARAGMMMCGAFAVALTGCRTVGHEHRSVYVPAPLPAPVVIEQPAPTPPPEPPPVVVLPPPQPAPVVVIRVESDFYEPLTPYGRWVVVGSYGRCWVPAQVEVGWRPYSNGYWECTDAGWYWVSNEPWGWATYHYGRWDWHAEFGWVWIPQTQWAPAWVSWREGGGYVGWAPLRPSTTFNVSIGVAVREPAFESRAFVFVERRRMLEPVHPKTVAVNNTTIINQTVNITNVKVENKTVINEGPRRETIERETGRKLRPVPVNEFRRTEEATVAPRRPNPPASAERNIHTAPESGQKHAANPPIPARDERKPEKPTAIAAPAKPVVAPTKPVTTPAKPVAAPARPQSPAETARPVHEANRRESEPAKVVTPPPSSRAVKPEVKPAPIVPPERVVRAAEKPVAVAKPPTVTPNPARDQGRRDPVIERKNPAPPTAVELRSKPETMPAVKPDVKPPTAVVKPPAIEKKPAAPPGGKTVENRATAPQEKPWAAARDQINQKAEENQEAAKKAEAERRNPTERSRQLR